MKNLILFLSLLTGTLSVAQTQDAWVFFADKENVEEYLADPISMLTQEALDRKAMHNVVIDERDVPVTESYISQIKNAPGITYYSKSKWMNCVYVQGEQSDIEDLLNLSFVTDIEWADKDMNTFPVRPNGVDDKFAIENQQLRIEYDYGVAANQIEMISGDYLHEQDFTGEGMIVAVMDSGFPDFETNPGFAHVVANNRLLGTFDFFSRTEDVTGTGTHGIRTSSDIGGFLDGEFAGTGPEVSFYLFRTEYGPDENPREEAWWVEALERADSLGVDVVNTSLGYQDYDNPNYDHSYEDLDGQTTFSARGANLAFDKGMILVTSAGNDGQGFGTVGTPGDAPGMLTVGAVNTVGNYVSFSSRGPTVDGRIKPDVMAKGQSAAVINSGGNVDFSNGTSFSSPIIAGAVACLWQASPTSTNAEVMQAVRESAHLFDAPTDEMGYGIPNFQHAYGALLNLGIEDQFLKQQFAIYPNPVKDRLNISFPEQVAEATIEIYNIMGKMVMQAQLERVGPSLDLSALSQGVYIMHVSHGQVSNSFKVVKN